MDRHSKDRKRKRMHQGNLFCVVLFTQEKDSVAAVPACWLTKSTARCFWPPKGTGPHSIDQMVRNRVKPRTNWQKCPCRVLGYADTYAQARRKMTRAEHTSHLESSDSSEDVPSSKVHDVLLRMPQVDDDFIERAGESSLDGSGAGPEDQSAIGHATCSADSPAVSHEDCRPVRDLTRTVPRLQSLPNDRDELLGRGGEDLQSPANQRLNQRIVQLLMEIRADIKELKGNYEAEFGEGYYGEIGQATSMEALREIEEHLADPDKRVFLTKKLGLIGGATADEATRLIMKSMVKTPVALQYTLEGRRDKPAFKDLRLYGVIVAAVQHRIPNADVSDINSRIGIYLRGARDRDGGRRARMK